MKSRFPGCEPGTARGPRAPARLAAIVPLLTTLLAAAPMALDAQPRPTRPDGVRLFAIENARVVTVSGATLEGATVVIDNGIIIAVGRNVDPPAGAWVIDGTGKTVYPGLFDALTTLGHGSEAAGGFGGFGASAAAASRAKRPPSRGVPKTVPAPRPGSPRPTTSTAATTASPSGATRASRP